MTRKERELAQRKEAILDSAQYIFESEGYFNATMAQIAGKAEFGVGTIYQFFPSKQALFAEVIIRGIEDFSWKLKNTVLSKNTWQDRMVSFVEYHLTWIENNPGFHRLVYEIFYSPIPDIKSQILERFKDFHLETVKIMHTICTQAQEHNESLDPEFTSLMVLGMIHAIADNWFLGILNKTPTEYIPGILHGILGGYHRENL
ncbi:MAG: TetR/AcrR family transcriptional regulator [Desulfomonilia bacterium]